MNSAFADQFRILCGEAAEFLVDAFEILATMTITKENADQIMKDNGFVAIDLSPLLFPSPLRGGVRGGGLLRCIRTGG